MGGKTNIAHFANIDIFVNGMGKLKFFLLSELGTFNGIIGHDTTKNRKTIIKTHGNYFTLLIKIQ